MMSLRGQRVTVKSPKILFRWKKDRDLEPNRKKPETELGKNSIKNTKI